MAASSFKSSNVRRASYDKKSRTLTITFKGERKYAYSDVPPDIYRRLTSVRSSGKFVNRNVAYSFPYKKVTK